MQKLGAFIHLVAEILKIQQCEHNVHRAPPPLIGWGRKFSRTESMLFVRTIELPIYQSKLSLSENRAKKA